MSKVAHIRVLVNQNGAVISWSVDVVSRSSWMVFIFCGGYVHVFTETYGWGKPRSMSGQMYRGVGRTRVGGHETRPKPKPNVDYYLVTYYYYYS